MYKRLKKSGNIILIMLIFIMALGGCSGKLTPKKIAVQTMESMTDVSSFANEVSIDIKLEDVVHVTEACIDLTMESTLNPTAGHVVGTASIKMYDMELESPLEIYQVTEDGESITYSGLNEIWAKNVSESSTSTGVSFSGGLLENLDEMIEDFKLAEENVTVNDKECYEMYGMITGADLKSIVGEEMMQAYGLVDIPEKEVIDELEIPVTIDIYVENMLPARVHVDMTDEMNELYDEFGESMNVNDFSIDLKFIKYNEVSEITVPEEVKQAAM